MQNNDYATFSVIFTTFEDIMHICYEIRSFCKEYKFDVGQFVLFSCVSSDASANIAKRVFGQDFKLSPWNMKDSMGLGHMNSDKSPEIEQNATKPSPDTKPTLTGAKPNSARDSNVDGAKETVTGQEQKKQANVSVCPEKPKGLGKR